MPPGSVTKQPRFSHSPLTARRTRSSLLDLSSSFALLRFSSSLRIGTSLAWHRWRLLAALRSASAVLAPATCFTPSAIRLSVLCRLETDKSVTRDCLCTAMSASSSVMVRSASWIRVSRSLAPPRRSSSSRKVSTTCFSVMSGVSLAAVSGGSAPCTITGDQCRGGE